MIKIAEVFLKFLYKRKESALAIRTIADFCIKNIHHLLKYVNFKCC